MNPTRRKSPQAPACESLEGRQLLAAGAGAGLGMDMGMGIGGMADVSMAGLGQAPAGHWGGQGGASQRSSNLAPGVTAGSQQAALSSQSTSDFGGQGHGGHMMRGGGQGDFGGMGGPADRGTMLPGAVGGTGTDTTGVPSQLKTDLAKLRTDQQAIHDKSNVTPAMEAKVRNDIKAIKGAETTTPDATATATLQADTKAAMANAGGPTDAQLARIQADQIAIYKSQGVSDGLTGQWATDLQAIKTASGITDADHATLAADQEAIQADRAAIAPPAPPVATPPASTATAATSTPADSNATTTTTATPTTTAPATPTTPAAAPVAPAAVPASTPVLPGVRGVSGHVAHHAGAVQHLAHRRRG